MSTLLFQKTLAMKSNPPKARRKTAEQDHADKRRVVIRLALYLPDHLIDWPYLVTLPRKRRESRGSRKRTYRLSSKLTASPLYLI